MEETGGDGSEREENVIVEEDPHEVSQSSGEVEVKTSQSIGVLQRMRAIRLPSRGLPLPTTCHFLRGKEAAPL